LDGGGAMSTPGMNVSPLLKGARDEFSFRRRIVDLLGGMLSPTSGVPVACKAMIVLLLFLCVTASFVLGAFILQLVASIINHQSVPTTFYAALLSGHALLGAAVGFPVTIRMTKLEDAKQLQAKLIQVQRSKTARGQTRVRA
jgi:hypothetical protein